MDERRKSGLPMNSNQASQAVPPWTDRGGAAHPLLLEAVASYESPLLRYVASIVKGGAHNAQDVVQETFVRLHAALVAGEEVKNLRSWLYRVAHNLSIDQYRRQQRRRRLAEQAGEDPAIGPAAREGGSELATLERHEEAGVALAELAELPLEQRQVLLMKVIEGMTLQEIADATGVKIGTVHYRLCGGLRELGRRLRAKGIT